MANTLQKRAKRISLVLTLAAVLFTAVDNYWKIQCKLPPKTKRFCPLVLK